MRFAPAALSPLVLALTACATPQVPPDFDACRAEAAQSPRVDSEPKRLAFIDACMVRKGWRPSPGCVETQFQGTPFCHYIDTR